MELYGNLCKFGVIDGSEVLNVRKNRNISVTSKLGFCVHRVGRYLERYDTSPIVRYTYGIGENITVLETTALFKNSMGCKKILVYFVAINGNEALIGSFQTRPLFRSPC